MSTTLISQMMELVGNKNFYQISIIAFLSAIWIQLTFILLGPAFIYMNPYFKCSFDDQNYVSESIACSRISECELVNDFTITGYVGLYCERQTERNIVQSVFYLGAILGLTLMNLISDNWGRRIGIISSCFICTLGVGITITGAFSKNSLLLCFGQFANGFGGYSLIILGYIYVSDICEDKLKQKAIVGMNGIIWGLCQMSFCALFYWYNQWYNFLIIFMFIPLVGITAISTFYIVQTPMFLYYKKKDLKKCLESLHFIAVYNNTDDKIQQIERKLKQNPPQAQIKQKEQQLSLCSILKNYHFLKIILSLALVQFSIDMYYYGIQYSLQQVGFNFGINVLIMGLIQMLGNILSLFLIDKIPRRKGLVVMNTILIFLGLLFCLPFISNNLILSTIILSLCRFSTSLSQSIVPMLQIQSFPSTVQSTGSGIIQALSQIGTFITPFIVTIATNLGINPVIVVSLAMLAIGVFPLKFVKQTSKIQNQKQNLIDQLNSSLITQVNI